MEEEAAVKAAPVTRLRRRLSVETEETKSPSTSTPSTPTKKRATRLAAKPQLELIDEHAVTESPKRVTRKSISRDIAEPEERSVTPARRSTRTKSNTSLVSEADEKPATPARRSTRIKSNTSIVSETVQSVESPRAKRATARRNSQVGSDTEAPITPARTRRTRKASTSSIDKEEVPSITETAVTPGRTRRTRKGSTSSIDTPAEAAQAEKPSLITEVIAEEPEEKLRKSTSNDTAIVNDNKDDSPTRKSPRLLAKKGRKNKSEDANETPEQSQENREQNLNLSTEQSHKKDTTKGNSKHDISVASAELLNDLDTKLKKNISKKNKSLSDVEYTTNSKKRDRTKSWTTLCVSPQAESNFYSDNEITKKKLKKHGNTLKNKRLSLPAETGNGDGPKQTDLNHVEEDQNLNSSKQSRKSKNKSANLENSIFEDAKAVDISNESNKENLLGVAPVVKETSAEKLLFESAPSADVKSMVFLEDSDSNNDNIETQGKQINNEDQCVPVVLDQSDKTNEQINIFAINNHNNVDTNDYDVEPMDIDETIPENLSFTEFSEENKKTRKSSQSILLETEDTNSNKSKRKSLKPEVNENVENQDNVDESVSSTRTRKNKHTLKQSPDDSDSKSEKMDLPVEDQNISTKKDKKSRKSSISVAIADSTKEDNVKDETENEDQNISKNESKRSRKSSLKSQESDSNKTKRTSTVSNSYSEDKNDFIVDDNDDGDSEKIQIKTRKSSLSIPQNSDENSKSKRKYSLSNTIDHDKTGSENKSTLVLSQIKDISAGENSVTKSPRNTSKLSKSINVDNTKEDIIVNKNLALNYLTSTPVQQKNIDKLTMPMNTSVISPTIENKGVSKLTKTTPKKNVSIISKSSSDNSSDEDSDESGEESSQEKSNLFDDQAEDAGEDYESGDSQDEDERVYERENEIIERGETLTSDEELSNDSDYEKDSFIVSSDEEDNELLSGSGDDLGMSDNELTLSAKSKKKYNERKMKEQKQASREMFEARHGHQNKSNQKTESKTSNRNRLDSSLLKSDEDILPPKKNKRMRLESTMESSQTQTDTEDSKSNKDISIASDKEEIGYKKKKSKRLSESVCNGSAINEKEITICNQSTTEREDPLLQVKTEPKTPLKDLDISRVQVTDDVEQVQVDENMSIMKANETSDPLQSTVLQEENDSEDDDDSISENEEISNNYDSILKDLNKDHKRQIKSQNISLNFEKKVKKTKEPIVEELNLTTTKVSKKDTSLQAKEKSVKRVFKKLADSDESSDSINMQLLFSEDSNGSKASGDGAEEKIIPLKKSDAKVDMRKSLDDANDYEGSLNFFIDTKGELPDANESDSNEAPVEILYSSNKKKNNSILKTPSSERKKTVSQSEDLVPDAENKTPSSGKKKKSVSESSNIAPVVNTQDSTKKKKLSISQDYKEAALPETPGSDKKARKVSESKEVVTKNAEEEKVTEETASNAKKRKRKSSANKTIDDIEPAGTKVLDSAQKMNDSVVGNKNKKVKLASSIDYVEESIATSGTEKPVSEQTDSKKSKKSKHPPIEIVSEQVTRKSKKRKERDEELETTSKVFKENSFDKVSHVPRLPAGIIEQLEEIPKNLPKRDVTEKSKAKKVVSTSNFVVEETLKRKNKPSDFLEETVYLNDDESDAIPKKSNIKKPKVLPFLPTVSTSYSGFTTNFQVNVISQKMEFVARNNDVPNFKNEYLNNKRIKKLRTYDLYKKQRNIKLSKY